MTGHIFISYSHEDGDFADILRREIEVKGFTAWMDEDRLGGGDTWRETIDQAIREAAALIVVMSPKAKDSEYVTYEWAFAYGAGIRVIPVLLKPTELHPRLEALQHRNFTNRSARPWDKLIEDLRKASEVADSVDSSKFKDSRDVPRVVKNAVDALDSMDPNERTNGVESLGQIDHPAAREAIVFALRHPTRDVRLAAVWKLKKAEYPKSRPILVQMLHDEDPNTRNVAAVCLGNIGDDLVASDLEDIISNDTEFSVRWSATKALGNIGGPESVSGLRAAVQDEQGNVCWSAIEGLGNIKNADVLPDLVNALSNENGNMRDVAVKALVKQGNIAIPYLVEVLNDERRYVHADAERALKEIGTPEALAALEE